MSGVDARLEAAYRRASGHRTEILESLVCGCFFCGGEFEPNEIGEWVGEEGGGGDTALCPHCGNDAVIGSASGLPITAEFLGDMHTYWFGGGRG